MSFHELNACTLDQQQKPQKPGLQRQARKADKTTLLLLPWATHLLLSLQFKKPCHTMSFFGSAKDNTTWPSGTAAKGRFKVHGAINVGYTSWFYKRRRPCEASKSTSFEDTTFNRVEARRHTIEPSINSVPNNKTSSNHQSRQTLLNPVAPIHPHYGVTCIYTLQCAINSLATSLLPTLTDQVGDSAHDTMHH